MRYRGRATADHRGPPLIRGAEEKVSSFVGVEIGNLSYLFILLGMQTRYLTEVREQLLRHVDAFGEDLGEGGKVVHAYESSKHQTFREVVDKRWPGEVLRLLWDTLEPVMLIIDRSFADFDPEVDNWGIIWFSTLESKPHSIPKVLHKLATLCRDGQDIFAYLDALRRRERLSGVIKYLKVDKVGAFGIFVDVEAIITDALGAAP
jgi:hypothetical protein